jgi:hypothetical protein
LRKLSLGVEGAEGAEEGFGAEAAFGAGAATDEADEGRIAAAGVGIFMIIAGSGRGGFESRRYTSSLPRDIPIRLVKNFMNK